MKLTGVDSFTYTARDQDLLDSVVTGTVTLTVSDMIWFIDSEADPGGDGTLESPFTSFDPLNDGGSADEARLQQAQKECRIETKLQGLERAREDRDKGLAKAATNQRQMLVKDEYEEIKRQVYREIDTCMNRQGYKR